MLLRLEFLRIRLEELDRLLRMHARDVMEGGRRDVVGLAVAHEGVVVEEVLQLGGVAVGLGAEDFFGFGSRGGVGGKRGGLLGEVVVMGRGGRGTGESEE
jgi:hypothetical protein